MSWQGGHLHPCRGKLRTGLGSGCTPSEASRDPYVWTRAPNVGLAAQLQQAPGLCHQAGLAVLTGLATRQCPPGRTLSTPTWSGSEQALPPLEPPTTGKGWFSQDHLPQSGCPAPRPSCQAGSAPWWPRGPFDLQRSRAVSPSQDREEAAFPSPGTGQNCPLPCCESQTGPRKRPGLNHSLHTRTPPRPPCPRCAAVRGRGRSDTPRRPPERAQWAGAESRPTCAGTGLRALAGYLTPAWLPHL